MANNPIDTNSFRHFLEIRGVKNEIAEPNNFILSNFKVVQDDIARDTYFGNEESQLEFNVSFGQPCAPFMDNNGVLISYLPSGAELLIEENKNYGNESDVKYILEKDNISFTIGNIDFSESYESDNLTYVKCRVIQNDNQRLIKKREDIVIDLLATEDLDDNPISAIPLQRMLLKAKPLFQTSTWGEKSTEGSNLSGTAFTFNLVVPISNKIIDFEIDNSYAPFDLGFGGLDIDLTTFRKLIFDNRLFTALNDLSNINIKIKKQSFDAVTTAGKIRLIYASSFFTPTGEFVSAGTVHSTDLESGSFSLIVNDKDYEINIPYISAGESFYIYLSVFFGASALTSQNMSIMSFSNSGVDITATSTAIPSVTNAFRQIDLIKQTYKAIGSFPVNASIYDVGGEFYDNFCFNKNLIRQDLTKPFYNKLKDVKEDLLEQCAFAQINDNEIYIGHYEDFYKNVDMGGFIETATYESSFMKNTKYLVNKYIFGYEKYEQDRSEKKTTDAIHTNTEWFVQANNSINTKEFKLPFLRDVFLIESVRRLVFSSKETSTSDDNNIFKIDVTQLPPNSRERFSRFLTWSTSQTNGTLQILSNETFSWNLLGFNVGDLILVNGVNHLVLEITPNILKLNWISGNFIGSSVLSFDYPLTNVQYVTRTNQGLIFSENIINPDNYGNLRYSIKRNMRNWFAILATYGKFIPTKKVKNTYFKSNGEATTQFIGEPNPIKENEDILIADISDKKILTQDIYKTTVKCTFEKAVQLLNDIQNVRGFIRVQAPNGSIIKGYVKEGDNVWVNEELSLELEIKNESDFLNVIFSSGTLTINEVGYPTKTTTEKRYNSFNDFIQFFDENNINLCNRTKFDKVSLNGITYDSIDELINALENL